MRLLTFLLLLLSHSVFSQHTYSGYVYDSRSKEPLPFVNIIADDQKSGFNTDIDGKFTITATKEITELKFFFIGYEPKTLSNLISRSEPGSRTELKVYLTKKPVSLGEVVVIAGENPAHRIINKAIDNRDINDPENLKGFSYTSYNKLIIGADSLELLKKDSLSDTLYQSTKRFLDRSHIFLSESVTKRNYRYKGLSNEKVLASRVSGIKNPLFTLLATQFQSFSFYKDYISVSDKKYLNPLSPNSTSKYIFILEDTTYSGIDTVYQISFQPRKGKNFEGLKGILSINTHGYAIQNVIAEPPDKTGTRIKIQQLYQLFGDKWFPVQLNTDIVLAFMSVSGRPAKGNSRSYLTDITIGEPLPKKEFSEVEVEVDANATEKDEAFWNQYRKDSLTLKDRNTYTVIDSIGKEEKLEEKVLLFNSFMSGRYPFGKIDLDIASVIDYNDHEGYRLGAGFYTNRKFSSTFTTGAYAAYGFRDESFKYGFSESIKLKPVKDGNLFLQYRKDVMEAGNKGEFLRKQSLLAEDYRRLAINMMDELYQYSGTFSFRVLKYLHTAVAFDHKDRLPLYIENQNKHYISTEVKAMFRFVYKEKFMQLLGDPISLGSDKPVVWFSFTKGIKGLVDGEYDYFRTDLMFSDKVLIRNVGNFSYIFKAGDLRGTVEGPFLYHIRGAKMNFALFDEESFQTLGLNEVFAPQYLNVFLKHDFGSLLMKSKHFSPALAVTSAVGYFKGTTRFETPYLESGLLVQDILKISFIKAGIGGFYRYGAHHLPIEKKTSLIN